MAEAVGILEVFGLATAFVAADAGWSTVSEAGLLTAVERLAASL